MDKQRTIYAHSCHKPVPGVVCYIMPLLLGKEK